MLSIYPACFIEEEAGYSVIFPDLNWLSTCGDTITEATEMAMEHNINFSQTLQETLLKKINDSYR